MKKSIDERMRIILKGVEEIFNEDEMRAKLERSDKTGEPLIIKLGLDPSAPDIHLGHTVVLRKMRQFQDMGHDVRLLIGDFTGRIGDPTGKSKARVALTEEQVMENAKTYEKQILKVLDPERTTIVFNSHWLGKLNFTEAIRLASNLTVARMLERDDFKKRYESHTPISVHEFFYPLMQGYDSVALKADVELGGTDQKFNLLMGRTLQREYGQEPQVAITLPIIEGLDGVNKMSKSLGNYIGIDEPAEVMYKKVMEIPDGLIIKYYNLLTDVHPDEVDKIQVRLDDGENPRDIKMELAKEITRLYYGEQGAQKAEDEFKNVFQKGNIPENILTLEVDTEKIDLPNAIVESGMIQSKSELNRLLKQGGVKINGEKVESLFGQPGDELVIQLGKKKFIKLIIK